MTTRERDWQPERFDSVEQFLVGCLRKSSPDQQIRAILLEKHAIPYKRTSVKIRKGATDGEWDEAFAKVSVVAILRKDAPSGLYLSSDKVMDSICDILSTLKQNVEVPYRKIRKHVESQQKLVDRMLRNAEGIDRFRFDEGIIPQDHLKQSLQGALRELKEDYERRRNQLVRQGQSDPLITDAVIAMAEVLRTRGAVVRLRNRRTPEKESILEYVKTISDRSLFRIIADIFGNLRDVGLVETPKPITEDSIRMFLRYEHKQG